MELGATEISLLISGIVCLVGVLGFRASSRDRQLAEMKEAHSKEIETHKWRTKIGSSMEQLVTDMSTVKTEQRALRDDLRDNAKTIHELEQRHNQDVKELSGRIDRVDVRVSKVAGSVSDLIDVMKGGAEQNMESNNEQP